MASAMAVTNARAGTGCPVTVTSTVTSVITSTLEIITALPGNAVLWGLIGTTSTGFASLRGTKTAAIVRPGMARRGVGAAVDQQGIV